MTYSGNTEELAKLIRDYLVRESIQVDIYEIGFGIIPDLSSYDYILMGTFTWDLGETPDEIKDFILDVGYKPDNVAVFGTGDTQFGGDDLFCRSAKRLNRFFNSTMETLIIEQSPRGKQENKVKEWTDRLAVDILSRNSERRNVIE